MSNVANQWAEIFEHHGKEWNLILFEYHMTEFYPPIKGLQKLKIQIFSHIHFSNVFLKTLLKCKEKYWSLVFCHANCLPRNLKSKLVYWEIYQNSFKYLRLNILIFLPPAGTELILEMISHWFITRSRSSCEDWSRVTQTLTALQVTLKYILLSW